MKTMKTKTKNFHNTLIMTLTRMVKKNQQTTTTIRTDNETIMTATTTTATIPTIVTK